MHNSFDDKVKKTTQDKMQIILDSYRVFLTDEEARAKYEERTGESTVGVTERAASIAVLIKPPKNESKDDLQVRMQKLESEYKNQMKFIKDKDIKGLLKPEAQSLFEVKSIQLIQPKQIKSPISIAPESGKKKPISNTLKAIALMHAEIPIVGAPGFYIFGILSLVCKAVEFIASKIRHANLHKNHGVDETAQAAQSLGNQVAANAAKRGETYRTANLFNKTNASIPAPSTTYPAFQGLQHEYLN